jgi:NAD+ kinase
MKIAIFGKQINEIYKEKIEKLFEILRNKHIEVVIYDDFLENLKNHLNFNPQISAVYHNESEIYQNVDFIFSIGGDGTFLETVNQVKNSGIPILGINTGRLGFLTSSYEASEFEEVIEMLKNKNYEIEKRTLLQMDVQNNHFKDFNFALNEITVHKHHTSSMITIHSYINDEFLNSYWADGLIVATPTGSTAYSLSVGGPIVAPNTCNLIITPIAPHNLSIRPIVISDSSVIKLKIESRTNSFLASLDQRSEVIENELEIIIKKANFQINTIKFPNQSFYKTIRNKLMWGLDKRN